MKFAPTGFATIASRTIMRNTVFASWLSVVGKSIKSSSTSS